MVAPWYRHRCSSRCEARAAVRVSGRTGRVGGDAARVAAVMAKRRRGRPRAAARRSAPTTPAARAPRRDWRNLGWALLPPLLAVAVYFEVLGNPFVYDDLETVVKNPSLRDLSNWVFVLVFSPCGPVVNVTYAVDTALWGLDPFGFHITGVLLHALNVALFHRFARALLHDRAAMNGQATAASRADRDVTQGRPSRVP